MGAIGPRRVVQSVMRGPELSEELRAATVLFAPGTVSMAK
jgi:hypothetical protein